MTFPEFLRKHHACLRGAAYVVETHGGNPYAFWDNCPRGDWLCWVLDAAGCEVSHETRQLCNLPYNVHLDPVQGLPVWWQLFVRQLINKGYDSLEQYLAMDKAHQWTLHSDEKTERAWMQSAYDIRAQYGPAWVKFVEGGFVGDLLPKAAPRTVVFKAKKRKRSITN